jgi:hypothetical protein
MQVGSEDWRTMDQFVLSDDGSSLAVNPDWLQALQQHVWDPQRLQLQQAEPGNDAQG